MSDLDLASVIDQCQTLESQMHLQFLTAAPSIRFSNTGRRSDSKKYFDINIQSLVDTFKDIKENLNIFSSQPTYDEGKWRNMFSANLTDEAVNAMSTVQTLPLFCVLSKLIYVINKTEEPFNEKIIDLNEDHIDQTILFLESQIPDQTLFKKMITSSPRANLNEDNTAENIIYYGAPGTGKSHAIAQRTNDHNASRIVFHPDTQYSDFVGCLKPSMNGNDIQYSFRAGPFTEAIIRASNNPQQHYYLVIEEINRAPAAAVFGEIFQLLDRDESGQSTYSIDVTDPDLLSYLNQNLINSLPNNKLLIPHNLSLLATMNSSDQAVMPMDTAFKRRWKFQYQKLDFGSCAEGLLPVFINGEEKSFSWKIFAQTVNRMLTNASIPEDRHLGPWFIHSSELSTVEQAKQTLTGKLLMYLWDDVLRHGRTTLIFADHIKTYGGLVNAIESDQSIFNENFVNTLQSLQSEIDEQEQEQVTLPSETE